MSNNIYLSVPFNEKDDAKRLGAKWDSVKMLWYIDGKNQNKNTAEARWPLVTILAGEDRSFGRQLYIDLIPSTMWYTNVRSSVSTKDWDRLRHLTCLRANYKCEICKKSEVSLDAHERFEYVGKKQILKCLIALCKPCHQATHMGLTTKISSPEYVKKIVDHFKTVNNMNDEQYEEHFKKAFDLWDERSKIHWELDLSMLTINGIKTLSKDEIQEKIKKAKEKTIDVQSNIVYDD
jgi:transcription elongation factor Elf1